MELWFTEKQTENLGITCKVNKTYHTEKTDFQDIALIDTKQFGKMLILDGVIQTTEKDEFVYHEMITHVPLFTHKNPERVLVVGGGDGGTVREVLKHPSVKKVTLAEIDKSVVDVSKKFLPQISCTLEDDRAEVLITDGIKYVKEHKNEFDVIIVDSTDPVGPAVGLFSLDFYKSIFDALKEDGIFVAQTESPFYNGDFIKRVFKDIKSIFSMAKLYLSFVPTYPGGLWCFTMGSKKYNPLEVNIPDELDFETKYYNPGIHKACFELPEFVKNIVGK